MRRASIGALTDLGAAWDDFQDAADDAISALVPVLAAIIEATLSLFPGIGSGLASAIAAGIALARGRPIEEVIVLAASGAIPGGAVGAFGFTTAANLGAKLARGETLEQAATETIRLNLPDQTSRLAFDAALNLAHGRDVGDAALSAIRSSLPPGVAQTAFDVSVKIARGEPIVQAALDLVRANLPPSARTAFDTTIAIAKGQPLTDVAIQGARAAAQKEGADAVAAFDLTLPMSRGVFIDPTLVNAVRSRISAPNLPAFDQTVSIAHAAGLQNAGFTEATTFMPWAPAAWDTAYTGYDPHSHRLADLMWDFWHASAQAQAKGGTALEQLEQNLFDELAALDPVQWDPYPKMIAKLERYRNNFEHDLQDNPSDILTEMFATDTSPDRVQVYGPPIADSVTRAALASVPFVEKPPFSDRKSKERGQQDILDAYARAAPNALARRRRITNRIALYKIVDFMLTNGAPVSGVLSWSKSGAAGLEELYGDEPAKLTENQIYQRLHVLAGKGLAKDDFAEWHLSPQTPTVQATWDTEAAFLAAPTLPSSAEYRRRATLETQLAARVLEGPADAKAKDLMARAAADIARATALDLLDIADADAHKRAAAVHVTGQFIGPVPLDTSASDAIAQAEIMRQAAVLSGPEPTTAAGYLYRGSLLTSQVTDFSDPRWAANQALAAHDFARAQELTEAAQPPPTVAKPSTPVAVVAAVAQNPKIALFVIGGGALALLSAALLVEGRKSR
jgi:hypothetical protein